MLYNLVAGIIFIELGLYAIRQTSKYIEGIIRYQERVFGYSRDKSERISILLRYTLPIFGVLFIIGGIYSIMLAVIEIVNRFT